LGVGWWREAQTVLIAHRFADFGEDGSQRQLSADLERAPASGLGELFQRGQAVAARRSAFFIHVMDAVDHSIGLTEAEYRQSLREGFVWNLVDPMKQPGTFLMRAVVRDAASERIGSASQYVQVPDTRKGQLAVSGIFLKLAPQELVSRRVVPPSAEGNEGKVETWSEGGPAVRRYRPGQGIVYGYAVMNPKVKGPAKEFQVGSQLRLFRNGKLYYTGSYSHRLEKSTADPTRLVGAECYPSAPG
jgi:hypothetical protein